MLLELIITKSQEVGLFDKQKYAWYTRFKGKDVKYIIGLTA